MVEIPLQQQTTESGSVQLERTGPHSHIRDLGLDGLLNVPNSAQWKSKHGLVGQVFARQALGIISKIIQKGKLAGRAILLAGPPGTGKTALAHALALTLSKTREGDVPFTSMAGSELYSRGMSKTESLTQALRRSIGVKIKEQTKLIEGEVVNITINSPTAEDTEQTGTIILKTTDMESEYNLGPNIIKQISRLKLVSGDIISLDVIKQTLAKTGHTLSGIADYDVHGAQMKFVPTPNGELEHFSETVHRLSLHELDVIKNSSTQGIFQLFSGDTGEIGPEVRDSVDKQVEGWLDEKKGELIPGVLFIDEVYMLDLECFSFLNRAIEKPNAPIIIMASNRGEVPILGTDVKSLHGIPPDMLQRLLIIKTMPYSDNEIRDIVKIRLVEEDVQAEDEAISMLVDIARESHSLRYSLQLIALANSYAKKNGEYKVESGHISWVKERFVDTTTAFQEFENQNKRV